MIESPLLADAGSWIDGRWITPDGSAIEVRNPASGDLLAEVPGVGRDETREAIAAAAAAMNTIAPLDVRRGWLNRIGELLLAHQSELARIITLEHGKPLTEAKGEVEYAAGFFHFFAGQLDALAPHRLPDAIRNCRWEVHHRPAGVVAAITPWNFPLAMLAKKVPAALGSGCGVVAKPASATPLSAIAFAEITRLAEIPPGMFNLVCGKSGPIGETMCTDPNVRLISFTGSTEVGRHLAGSAAPHIKRLAMELGGNAPFIVFQDADLDAAARALLANKFRSAGQTCVCTNRVFAAAEIEAQFTERVAGLVRELRVGDGLDPATQIGPLINRDAFDKVTEHVQNALDHGATRVVGEQPPRPEHDWGCFYPPTLLTGIEPEMTVCQEETFGPVVAIQTFSGEAEAITRANDTEFGLAAYLFSGDPARRERAAAALQYGHVGVNTGQSPTPEAPFGGVKQSGYGREGGVEGLLEYCESQTIVTGD